MKKRTLLLGIVLALSMFFTAGAEASGFYGEGWYTDTTNGYFFDHRNSLLIDNEEQIVDFNYDEFHAGSILYLPLQVYEGNAITGNRTNFTSSFVGEDMVEEDDVAVTSKVVIGPEHIGTIELVYGPDEDYEILEDTMYVKIPLILHYENLDREEILIRFVLSVHGTAYRETTVNMSGFIVNRTVIIGQNASYSAKHPTRFDTRPDYNGEVTFDFGDGIRYTTRVKGNSDYYLGLSREPDDNIVEMYSERNTFLDFYNFKGVDDLFQSAGALEIPVSVDDLTVRKGDPQSLYVYRIEDGELYAMDIDEVSYDLRRNMLTITTNSLDNYVLSNIALLQDIDDINDNNIIKTGYADDIVPEEDVNPTDIVPEDYPSPDTYPIEDYPLPEDFPVDELEAARAPSRDPRMLGANEGEGANDDTAVEDEFFSSGLGSPIAVANPGAQDNPSTGDPSHIPPAVLAMVAAAVSMFVLKRG